jgi:phage baseplate assembly protein gpV
LKCELPVFESSLFVPSPLQSIREFLRGSGFMNRLRRIGILLMVILFFLAPVSTWAQLTTPLAGSSGTTTASLGQGSLITAYSQITTTTPTQPGALANYGFTQNGILTTEVGVAASAPTTAARMFVDYSTANGTDGGLAVANPSSSAITLNVQLNNAQGIVTTCPNQTVPANGHLAMFASQLCPNIPNPYLGTLTLTSSTAFAATNLMSGTNSHGEPLYNSLPVATPNAPPADSHLYFSQFADGGGFSTEILLMNLTVTPISGTVSFTDDNGHAVTLNFGPSIGSTSTLNYSIPGNGMLKFTTTGSTSGTPVQAGAVVVTSTAGALPSVAVVFSSYNGTGGLASQAGVLNSPVTTYARMYVEKSNSPLTRDTGVAIVNPNSSTATVQLNLVSLDGLFTASNTITVPANNHMAAFIDQSALMGIAASVIPSNFQGVLTLSSDVPTAPVTLRSTTNQRGENLYSTLPVVDLNNPPAGPLYLPQIADGGGFTTQIILINTSSSSGNVTMNFFNELGSTVHIWFSSEVVQRIAAGGEHSLALRSDGTVWAWGYNGYGELGNGTTTDSSVPVEVQGLTNVVAIAAGLYHSLALRSDGTVWAWGENYYGQLGNGTTTDSSVPVEVQGLTTVIAIAGGYEHSLALSPDFSQRD